MVNNSPKKSHFLEKFLANTKNSPKKSDFLSDEPLAKLLIQYGKTITYDDIITVSY